MYMLRPYLLYESKSTVIEVTSINSDKDSNRDTNTNYGLYEFASN